MKNKYLATLSLLFAISLTSCGENTAYKFSFADMDEDVMPISGWIAPASIGGFNTLEQYQVLKESGLNCIYGHYDRYGIKADGVDLTGNPKQYDGTEEILKSLDYASRVGVKYFVRDPLLFEEDSSFKETFESRGYTNYPSFAGFHYMDEPQTHEAFETIKADYNKFRSNVDSKYAFYVNLNPLELFTNNGGFPGYINHVNDYIDTVNPRFISFDFYCPKGPFPSVKSLYFNQLEIISKISQERKIPFWAFALATGHSFSAGGYYRAPTETDIYFQVNTILAYGAKAVQYFCYQTPLFTDEHSKENYHEKGGSIINEYGQKSEIFPYIKKMNNFIASIDHLLLNSTRKAVMAVEHYPACYISEDHYDSYENVKSLSSNDDILINIFDHKGKPLYYCVNTSLQNDSTFTLDFKLKKKFNVYDMDKDIEKIRTKNFTYSLKPGRAVILEVL